MNYSADGERFPEESRQDVHVESGFGYGVVGADLHVFGDGTPVYVLENRRATPACDPEWLRDLPSRMLNARHEVVPFTGRDAELAQLHRWRRSNPRLAARWLHGPGGQGKTRLAAQFAAQSAADGWKVVTAVHGPGTVLPPPGSQDLRLRDARGVLIILDYADRWPLTHLTWLFSNALLHRAEVPARVLLLARTEALWPAVRATLANHQAGTSAHLLEALPADDPAQRAQMFTAARDSFAAHHGIGDPTGIRPPGPLEHEDFGLTLALHMAALVAVDARVTGRRPPRDMAGLTVYLLDREHLHWARLHGDGTHELNPAERTYRTPPAVMNRAVFAAALTGAVPHPVGTAVLGTLGLEPARQILADHSSCYPPEDSAATVLEPLYPDRLAEDFLALTLPGHPADYPAQPWAQDTATTVLTAEALPAAHSFRAIPALAAAAQRWPHVGASWLYPLLRRNPWPGLRAGSAGLTALAALPDIDIAVLEALEASFPSGRHVDLDIGMAAVTHRLAQHRLARTEDPQDRAGIHLRLAHRLHNAGRYQEALSAVQACLPIRYTLASADPAAHELGLAEALDAHCQTLLKLGRSREALVPAQKQVDIVRRLVRVDPFSGHGLAHALGILSQCLSSVGRRQEALAASQEAVAIHRRMMAGPPSPAEAALLVPRLDRAGGDLLAAGRVEEALAVFTQSWDHVRSLMERDPNQHASALAATANNISVCLSALDRSEETLHYTQEAVTVLRRLAKANPAAYESGLAGVLSNLGITLAELKRPDDALIPLRESVALRSRLAKSDPTAHEPGLAKDLSALGQVLQVARDLSNFGMAQSVPHRLEEASTAVWKAVNFFRRLAAAEPAAYESDLARVLTDLSQLDQKLGRSAEALANSEAAVVLCRRLSASGHADREESLAHALIAYGRVRILQTVEVPTAMAALSEAMSILHRLNEKRPHQYDGALKLARAAQVGGLSKLGDEEGAARLLRQILLEGGVLPGRTDAGT